jgi:RNA polymerase sigma-70 factor, ECF subfamily
MLNASSDLDLTRAVCEGSEAAFRELLGRHLQPLRAFLSLRVPVPDLIDEVAHDAFVLAHRRMSSFKENSMQPWLRAIAQNILRDRLKAYARETVRRQRYGEQLRLEIAQGSSHLPISGESDHLDECLSSTPPKVRHLLALRYEHELSSEEIAEQTGRSALAIRTLLVRVRRQLKQCIEERMARVGT